MLAAIVWFLMVVVAIVALLLFTRQPAPTCPRGAVYVTGSPVTQPDLTVAGCYPDGSWPLGTSPAQ